MGLMKRCAGILSGAALAALLIGAAPDKADAALVTAESFTGNVGLSTDGWGSLSNVGDIRASAPSGSTVLAAYLYTSTFFTTTTPSTVSFGGSSISYTNTVSLPSPACCDLRAHRVDVTSLVKPVIDGGSGGVYNFGINEGSDGNSIDGHALVVVYSNPALPNSSVGILDGFARVDGDTTSINFAKPLDPEADGFFADMVLGIGFSCCNSQQSRVEVNGELLTQNAGNKDDGVDGVSNGNLITVGSFDDPYSPIDPSYDEDHERYDLTSFIKKGDTSIKVDTFNASRDDLIFLAAFHVSGEAGFNEPPSTSPVPLPAAAWTLLAALGGLGALRRRKKAA